MTRVAGDAPTQVTSRPARTAPGAAISVSLPVTSPCHRPFSPCYTMSLRRLTSSAEPSARILNPSVMRTASTS